MTYDKRDHSGIVAPPPLIYLRPLVLGCCSTEYSRFPLATRFEARPGVVAPQRRVLLTNSPTRRSEKLSIWGECYTIVEVFAAKCCIHHPYLRALIISEIAFK